mmetsp:Transcript_5793/g.16278  ORF Transcript_5793/g.16278 Transcript_5793/m.16278 type:complete len:89 (-) Transcript_5793:1632-1898(-)
MARAREQENTSAGAGRHRPSHSVCLPACLGCDDGALPLMGQQGGRQANKREKPPLAALTDWLKPHAHVREAIKQAIPSSPLPDRPGHQ